MSPTNRDLVRRKLELISENLRDLTTVMNQGKDHYLQTRTTRKLAERCIQEAIEAAADTNAHILSENGFGAPEDYRSGFQRMGEAKIIPLNLANELVPAAGLRNRIVHQYDRLDHEKIFHAIQELLKLLPRYIDVVNQYV